MRKKTWFYNFIQSLWIIPTLLPLGMGSFLSFLFVGIRLKKINWTIAGLIYLFSVYCLLITLGSFEDIQILVPIITVFILLIWATSVVHALWINRTYLNIIKKRARPQGQSVQQAQAYSREEIAAIQKSNLSTKNDKLSSHKTKAPTQKVNINRATALEISALPGIDSLLAQTIIKAREENNGFEDSGHLIKTVNLKPHILHKALPHIAFSDKQLQSINKKASQEQKETTSAKRPAGRRVDF